MNGRTIDNTPTPESCYLVHEVADMLRVTPDYVRKIVANGELRGFKIGRAIRITASELRRFQTEGSERGIAS